MHASRTSSSATCPSRPPRAAAGFTLIELLVVIAVLGIVAGIAFSSVGGAEKSTALRSAQATMANALSAARHRALARGVPVVLAVHDDPASPTRYRRLVAVVESIQTAPEVVGVFELPKHAYVLPHRSRFPEALREAGDWTGGSSENLLGSTRFLSADGLIQIAINSPTAERWEYALVTARGTMSGSGALIVGLAQPAADGPFPIRFESPERVRGMMISQYGLARMIDGREGF